MNSIKNFQSSNAKIKVSKVRVSNNLVIPLKPPVISENLVYLLNK
jgi:hypothetical protein